MYDVTQRLAGAQVTGNAHAHNIHDAHTHNLHGSNLNNAVSFNGPKIGAGGSQFSGVTAYGQPRELSVEFVAIVAVDDWVSCADRRAE